MSRSCNQYILFSVFTIKIYKRLATLYPLWFMPACIKWTVMWLLKTNYFYYCYDDIWKVFYLTLWILFTQFCIKLINIVFYIIYAAHFYYLPTAKLLLRSFCRLFTACFPNSSKPCSHYFTLFTSDIHD